MRYGNPAIGGALDELRAAGCERILVLPLYPQYAASTTAARSTRSARIVAARAPRARRCASSRASTTTPGYIQALAQNVNDYWMKHGRPEQLVLSFHGLPRRTLDRGDPYHCQCQKTARLLARELGLDAAQWSLAFQSRFGRAEWLKPYTPATLVRARARTAWRASTCSARASSPIASRRWRRSASRAAARSCKAGGKEFHAIPCLNEHPAWIAALADLALAQPAGLARAAAGRRRPRARRCCGRRRWARRQ